MPPRPCLTADPRAYSLIELLAVMAILSALAGLTVGSLSPVKANALTAGGNQIADVLTLARQNSLSRHAFTAVIIKTAGDARYSAFCLLELTRQDNGEVSPEWKMISPWRTLPEGVRFHMDSDFLLPANCFTSVWGKDLPTSLNFRGSPVNLTSKTDSRAQIFEPSGALVGAKTLRLRLAEGAQDSVSGIMYTGQQDNNGDPVNYYDIVLLRETGQAKVERP